MYERIFLIEIIEIIEIVDDKLEGFQKFQLFQLNLGYFFQQERPAYVNIFFLESKLGINFISKFTGLIYL